VASKIPRQGEAAWIEESLTREECEDVLDVMANRSLRVLAHLGGW
jgi:hypothetical protein